MSETGVQSVAEGVPGLTQWQRVVSTFTAPSKTFEDIKRGNRSWWMPFIITILSSYILVGAITLKIGWAQVAENTIHFNPSTAEKLEQAPPAQREMTLKFTQYGIEGSFFASPILALIFVSLGSLVLWGTSTLSLAARQLLEASSLSGFMRVCRES